MLTSAIATKRYVGTFNRNFASETHNMDSVCITICYIILYHKMYYKDTQNIWRCKQNQVILRSIYNKYISR